MASNTVSTSPAVREDIIHLQRSLDKELRERRALENCICPVRRELYSQCFDELIRQVTIDCPERGILLMRIRDEIGMTRMTYEALSENSISYGEEKSVIAEAGKVNLEKKIEEITKEQTELCKEFRELQMKFDEQECIFNDKMATAEIKYVQEEKRLQKHILQVKDHLEVMKNWKKQKPKI